jgi:uncharacterized membrane protein YphA (DoxX/SURF4 family)
MNGLNIAALLLRLVVGGTLIAHGWNHAFGGGKLPAAGCVVAAEAGCGASRVLAIVSQ